MKNDQIMNEIATYFEVDSSKLTLDSGPIKGDVDGWDSIAHLSLIMHLEDKFSVKFSMDEIYNLKSIENIIEVMKS